MIFSIQHSKPVKKTKQERNYHNSSSRPSLECLIVLFIWICSIQFISFSYTSHQNTKYCIYLGPIGVWTDKGDEENNNDCFTKYYNGELINFSVKYYLNYWGLFVLSTLSNLTSLYALGFPWWKRLIYFFRNSS